MESRGSGWDVHGPGEEVFAADIGTFSFFRSFSFAK